MKLVLALVLGVTLAAANNLPASSLLHTLSAEEKFRWFEVTFEKAYADETERQLRFDIFKTNLDKIEKMNKANTWKSNINQFADRTEDEFKARLGYVNLRQDSGKVRSSPRSDIDVKQLPASVDWREKGLITPVKDQKSCGSCWAFAAVESIESHAMKNSGQLVELSAEQITSCTPNELECGGTGACAGSVPQLGFTYVELFGLVTEADYGYTSGDVGTQPCTVNLDETPAAARVRGFEVLERNDPAVVMQFIAEQGPLAVAVDASNWGFYSQGVFEGCSYDKNIVINHAVQLVGYGTDDTTGQDYWIIRNSWGDRWGEDGYIRLLREPIGTPMDDMCGMDTTPLSGVGCVNDGVPEQMVCGMCGVLYDVNYPIGATIVQ